MKKNKLLIIVAYIAILFTSLHALNCGQFGTFTQHNGHYYTTTKDRLTFEYAKTFAELSNGYLAIPNNSAENDFLASLVLGNQFAWIGIYDPSLSNNYCYETGSCSYDSSRFKTIKNSTLTFSNWGANQPDNLLKTSDVGQFVDITPLGEHWVALNSVSNKWYDFGNHNDEYNNPAKFLAIYEFDTKPECFKDDNSSELVDLHCNTAVSSKDGLTSDSGQLLQCQKDAKGVSYCPASLAACQNTQNTNDGYSQEHSGITTIVNEMSCPTNTTKSQWSTTYINGSLVENGSVIDGIEHYTGVWGNITSTTLNHAPGTYSWQWKWNALNKTGITVKYDYKHAHVNATFTFKFNGVVVNVGDDLTSLIREGENIFLATMSNTVPVFVPGVRITATRQETSIGSPMCLSSSVSNANKSYYCASGTYDGSNCVKTTCTNANVVYSCSGVGSTISGDPTHCNALVSRVPSQSNSASGGSLSGTYAGSGSGTLQFNWLGSYGFYNGQSGHIEGTWRQTTSDGGTTNINYNGVTGSGTWSIGTLTIGSSWNYLSTTSGQWTARFSNYNFSGTFSVNVQTTVYVCPSGSTEVDGVCVQKVDAKTSYTCSTGSLSGSQCCTSEITSIAQPVYACQNNSILNAENKCVETTITSAKCNTDEVQVGNTCTKEGPYTYYTYHCNADTNVYGETFVPQNVGGEGYINSTPPTNNCVQQNYVCSSNPDQTCANVDGVWKCSEHPCVDANDIEHTDTEVGSQDGDDDGWNKNTGACEGQLYLFGGTSKACRSWDLFSNFVTGTAVVGSAGLVAALDDSNCCSDDAVLFGLISCKSEEKLLAEKKKAGNCHDIGEFCSKKIRLGFAKICVQKKKSSCCFNSKLARIINEQGRPQLGKGWGSASNPECKGFTPEEFQKLDLSKIDFNEFIESFQLPNIQNIGDSIRNRVTGNLSVSFPQH